jgi:hypothetical protein
VLGPLAPACAARVVCALLQGAWNLVQDDGQGMTREQIEYGVLAHGGAHTPEGNKIASFFNTGHVAAMAVLAEDIIIATVRANTGIGTLTRWVRARARRSVQPLRWLRVRRCPLRPRQAAAADPDTARHSLAASAQGSPVTEAILRALPPSSSSQRKVHNAYIQFDMRTGELVSNRGSLGACVRAHVRCARLSRGRPASSRA